MYLACLLYLSLYGSISSSSFIECRWYVAFGGMIFLAYKYNSLIFFILSITVNLTK